MKASVLFEQGAPLRVEELDLGETKANAQVAGFLFNAAKNGNVTAQIFWLKTRAKWRESPVELKHSGSIAKNDLSELPDAELLDIIYTLGREVGLAPVKTIEGSLTSGEPAPGGPLISARD